ncbi:hypothetical protein AB833_06835 [Chromatiales bacterium (ex Bugula neritina AB1)]|nr:hypothetical protein AB833_06835 [Chromatiales bacterium (ex Bugula neritina AB1)]
MQEIHTQAFARAGLIGNPSDGYNGKTIAFSVRNFSASVWLTESANIEIVPHGNDIDCYSSISSLHDHISLHGYYGGVRLIKATIKLFFEYCRKTGRPLHGQNFTIRYDSAIPQQVGLAGSSAIIVATLRALMKFYSVKIDQVVQPSLVLAVEQRELGISGGLQDRVIQVYEGLMQMDFTAAASQQIDGFECGSYQRLEVSALPSLYLAYRPATSEPTEVFHNDLRARFDAGEVLVRNAMKQFARLTDEANSALQRSDSEAFFNAINENYDLRNSMCSLNPLHSEMVAVARSQGASAKFAGSGGAIVGSYKGDDQYRNLEKALQAIGCVVFKPDI